MNAFQFGVPTIVFANGSSARLHEVANGRLGERVLFVTNDGLRRLGLCDAALAALMAIGIAPIIF